MLFEYISTSPEATEGLGFKLGKVLLKGDIVCLSGDLGTGKTTLTKSIAEALEVHEYVTSPSYTIVNEYEGRLPVYHFDVYRINEIEELYEIGYEEYFFGQGVTIIEWASMIMELIPDEAIKIVIERLDDTQRRFEISASEDVIHRLEEVL
ncbi:MAG: tRNA (adenosine(37)-N6)-threonylcarbamoyltransferase complex ATPase subunit type 1 TsaE [Clostridia bacterium]|nr:tRNA (adenosine(37)-N6)-threonylcarbamoyltransferase complex ATPase subunit type 1 TsaE [Clostridia bacterium]